MIELELTYLARNLPEDLDTYPVKDMRDAYIPVTSQHPTVRVRKNGEKYEITKKTPIKEGDASYQREETIIINAEEYNSFSSVAAKRIHKLRYQYPVGNYVAEVDVFQDDLVGLVLIDFEFTSEDEKNVFMPPEFCLKEVTQEKFIAGGMLCGKRYEDIEERLNIFGYKKIDNP